MSHSPAIETQVNTYTDAYQSEQQITALTSGGWVVTWQSTSEDGSSFGVYQQAYNADGTTLGTETQVNSYTTAGQYEPQITALTNGGWVVTWQSYDQDGSEYGLYQQAYNADGTTLGVETQVNTYTTGTQSEQRMTALAGGGWVITWDTPSEDGSSFGVYQQIYDADGTAHGVEAQVNTYTISDQSSPQITTLADGGWVVTWTSDDQDGDEKGIYQQAYNADGTARGVETQVNTGTNNYQEDQQITALAHGGWVVTWMSSSQDGDSGGIYQQAYNADGTARGVETRVNTETAGDQERPQITALAGGGWVVTWMSDGQDGDGSGIYQQAYNADGSTRGVETLVNTHTTGDQSTPHIAALAGGGWVVTWISSGQDGDGSGVYQQAYNADGSTLGDETRVNTYTAGSQEGPQITALADGGWVVTWMSDGEDGSGLGVYQQRYDAEGQVYGTNHAPTASDATVTALEDTSYTFSTSDFGFSDGTDGDSLSAVIISTLPASGTLTLNGVIVHSGDSIDASDIAAGKLTYVPAADANGTGLANLTFKVVDDGGTANGGADTSTAHTITFDVTAVNDAPAASDQTASMLEDSSYTFTTSSFGFSDTDGDHLSAVIIATLPASGTLTLNGVAVHAGDSIDARDIAAGKLIYAPATDANGSGLASLTFKVVDDGGTANGGVDTSARHTITFDVTAVNDAPTASDHTISMLEDGSFAFATSNFGFSDSDGGHLSKVIITTLPASGTLTLNGVAVHAGDSIDASDIAAGKLIYVPAANANGTGLASLVFKVVDDGGTANGGIDTSAPHTITFNVTAASDAPTASDHIVSLLEDGSYTFATSNFGFSDADGDHLSAVIISGLPASGTLTLDGVAVHAGESVDPSAIAAGKLVYIPAADANGRGLASLIFEVVDNSGVDGADTSASHRITFDVVGVPAVETEVSTHTTGDQYSQQVTALADGGWVVTWQSYGQDGSNVGVYQQVYNADGTARGEETQVNSYTTGDQSGQQVTALADGGWVVTWESSGQDGSRYGIYQQVYNADGTLHGAQTQVNTYTTGSQDNPEITTLADGRWVVTWQSDLQDGTVHGIYQQAYNADGTAHGVETRVSPNTVGNHFDQQITALADGGWVVTWESYAQDGDSFGVYQQAFHADGSAEGIEIRVNTGTTGNQDSHQVTALADGGWLVTWKSPDQSGSVEGIYQQAFHDDGTTLGVETRVNTDTSNEKLSPTVTALADGGWVVAWTSNGQDGDSYGVYQQTYNADGTADGAENRVNTYTSGSQSKQQVTALADGGWVVTWGSYGQDGDNSGIYQQVYNADGSRLGDEVQVNTYTTGRQAFQQITALADGGWLVTWDSSGQDGDGVGIYQQRYDAEGQIYGTSHAPTAADATLTAIEDMSYTFSTADFGFADAIDRHDRLSAVIITSLPASGMLTLNGVAVHAGDSIGASDIANGKLIYVPVANAHGAGLAGVTFKVVDNGSTEGGGFNTSTPHTLTLDVASVNDAPTASDNTFSLLEDAPHTFSASDFGFSDGSDGNSLDHVTITALPASGMLTLNGVAVTANQHIAAADLSSLVWTPAANAHGTGLASLTFTVTDNGGTAHGGQDTSSAHTITFNVTAVSDAPTAQDTTLTVLEDHSLTLELSDFGFADVDNDNLNNVYVTGLPAKGMLTLDGQAVTVNTAIIVADIAAGKLLWTPAANDNGDGLASLTFRVQDDGGTANGGSDTSAAHTLTFNVTAVDDAPVLGFDMASTFENKTVTMDVLADASDVDGDSLSITSASVTSGFGSVSVVHGKLVYDPTTAPNQNIDAGESRPVKVSYTVSDGHGGDVSETIAITVNGVSPDVFRGTNAAETLTGSHGDDIVYGLGGNDLINGGAGADDMRGGKGNDVYVVDDKHDSVSEAKRAGTDLVRASVSFTLGANVERLQLTGTAAIDANGNGLANLLTGNRADNALWGGLGADQLSGGKGADTFLFRDIAESTVTAGGRDLILDFSHKQHDHIDLHLIDANETKAGNQAFRFIGTDHFDGHAGELRFTTSSGHALIQADTDGDQKADFAILLDGVTALKAGDFLL